jgi:hypothetical protein
MVFTNIIGREILRGFFLEPILEEILRQKMGRDEQKTYRKIKRGTYSPQPGDYLYNISNW